MPGTLTFVGMDVHARSTHAAAINLLTGEIERMKFGAGVDSPVQWLSELPGPVYACYEAGPTGFGLHRAATQAGLRMDVVAPGKTPRGSADRVKTDRRDAELLARLLLAGQLSAIRIPNQDVEAARELTRLHDACRRDLMTARHRVSKMLLRHGQVYPRPTTWGTAHRKWLADQRFAEPMSELVYLDLLTHLDALGARKRQLAQEIARVATDERWWPIIARLRCFRAIGTLTALSIHLELSGDWRRFQKAPQLGAWLGLTPSLNQSGESSVSGSITKTGSTLARRLLVEAAWNYGSRPYVGPTLQARQEGQPEQILAISSKAQRRLYRVYNQLKARGKPHHVTTVAVARELACFLWAAATAD
jgi:transposase